MPLAMKDDDDGDNDDDGNDHHQYDLSYENDLKCAIISMNINKSIH